MDRELAEAAARWNADHPRDYPRQHGTCPVCGGRGCWGALPDAPGRWVCFDTDHARIGVQGRECWHGDALDLEAHALGVRRADVLRRDGYLDGPAKGGGYRPRPSPPPRPRVAPLPSLPPLLGAPMAPTWRLPALRWPSARAVGQGSAWLASWLALEAFVRSPLDLPAGPDLDARKRALSVWSPTVREGDSRAEGTPVLAVSALVLDLDAVPAAGGKPAKGEPDLSPDRLHAAMEEHFAGIAWLAHTSPSSTRECWRWRVVVPFAEPVDLAREAAIRAEIARDRPHALAEAPDDHGDLLRLVRLRWRRAGRTALDADPGASSPTRAWYQPARRPEDPAAYVPLSSRGNALDVAATLAALGAE